MTDRYGANAAAAYVNVAPSTWRAYVARGQAPEPDGVDEGFGKSYWLQATLDEWKNNRPGAGYRRDVHEKKDGSAPTSTD